MKTLIRIIIIIAFATSCSSNKQPEDGLVCIDVKKNYSEKEILLTDIADVTYLYLSSDDADYLYSGRNLYVTKNTVVVLDNRSGNILFFTKDGVPKSHFNHNGQGPEEYLYAYRLIYDEKSDEVFVVMGGRGNNIVQVYSSKGVYKRKITLPQEAEVFDLIDFDDHSFFFFDILPTIMRDFALRERENFPVDDYVLPFYRISKTTGEVLDRVELPGTDLKLGYMYNDGRWVLAPRIYALKCPEGVLLGNAEADTMFLYSDKNPLTPVIYQTPPAASLSPVEYISRCLDRDQYQFIQVNILREGEFQGFFPAKHYMRNKKTGETVRPKFLLPNYQGKEFSMDPNRPKADGRAANDGFIYEDGYCLELGLYELKEAYRENKLSGKLKELVATLDEDNDNNIFMLVDFK